MALMILTSCSTAQKSLEPFPVPVVRPRPSVYLFESGDEICTSLHDSKQTFLYVVDLETELEKAIVTIESVNEER